MMMTLALSSKHTKLSPFSAAAARSSRGWPTVQSLVLG